MEVHLHNSDQNLTVILVHYGFDYFFLYRKHIISLIFIDIMILITFSDKLTKIMQVTNRNHHSTSSRCGVSATRDRARRLYQYILVGSISIYKKQTFLVCEK